EAVLVLEDLEVELLDDVVGLRAGFQAGIVAVQEGPGVVHQAVAGEVQQPLPGLGVARHGPLQMVLKNRGRFVAHGARSLRSGRPALRFSLSEAGTLFRKNPVWRYPSGRLPPGGGMGRKSGRRAPA